MAVELLKAVHKGSLTAVESFLSNNKGAFDRQAKDDALLAAVWRNCVPIVECLLAEDASPDTQDGESGWSSLHRALYWGHMPSAALLLEAGAQLHITDHKGRSPVDHLSSRLASYLTGIAETEVFTWGNGASYQLGSGAVGLQLAPVRLEAFRDVRVLAVAAAKFHSAALGADGQLYTWGFGRGGRLGHAEFHIHSGQSAVILPQRVAAFSKRRVVSVAAAKHHTAAVTSAGELFTWGSNRDGRLGYPAGDTQPTPRKISTFNRQRVAAVAVANRHTVALLEGGAVFSWGSNLQGQLGYGTADSASNPVPRIVEAMKGRHITAVSAAKRHTMVLTHDGEVFTWGHRVVTPKRVVLAGARDVARAGGTKKVVFHNGQAEISRPVAVAIAAGAAHSSAVTAEGVVLAWRSMDPALRPQEVGGSLAGKRVVAISAGKYRTAVVTHEGDVYMWEGWSKAAEAIPRRGSSTGLLPVAGSTLGGASPQEQLPPEWDMPRSGRQRRSGQTSALAFQLITPQRVEGVKRISGVAVGEKHSIALQSWCCAPSWVAPEPATAAPEVQLSPRGSASSALEDVDCAPGPSQPTSAAAVLYSEEYWDRLEAAADPASPFQSPEKQQLRPSSARRLGPVSLQRQCERRVAVTMVEPRTVLQVLEYADAAGAHVLRRHCLGVALSNLDLVLLEARAQFEQLPPHLLEELSQQWAARFPLALPAPQASGCETAPTSPVVAQSTTPPGVTRSFKHPLEEAAAAGRARQERTIRKKLQQIEALSQRTDSGPLDGQQLAKLAMRPALNAALEALQAGRSLEEVRGIMAVGQSSAATSSSPQHTSSPHYIPSRKARRRSKGGSSGGSSPACVLTPESSSVDRVRRGAADSNQRASVVPSVLRVAGFAQEGSSPPVLGAHSQGQLPSQPPPDGSSPLASLPEEPEAQSRGSRSETPRATPAKKPSRRKGRLSMFLAGQLEDPQATPPQPPPPKKTSPLTWALRSQSPAQPASLSDILTQEEAQSSTTQRPGNPARGPAESSQRQMQGKLGARASEEGDGGGGIAISLGDLVKKSKPIAMTKAAPAERAGPAWGVLRGGSPSAGSTRLQDIQAEQQQARETLSRSWGTSGASPGGMRTSSLAAAAPWRAQTGFVSGFGSSPGSAFPAGTSPGRRNLVPSPQPQSKWYIQEEQEIVPLQSIQTEESAIKELAELYGAPNVRVVPRQKPLRS